MNIWADLFTRIVAVVFIGVLIFWCIQGIFLVWDALFTKQVDDDGYDYEPFDVDESL